MSPRIMMRAVEQRLYMRRAALQTESVRYMLPDEVRALNSVVCGWRFMTTDLVRSLPSATHSRIARKVIEKPLEAVPVPIRSKPKRSWNASDAGFGGSRLTSQQRRRAPRIRATPASVW